MPLFVCVHGAGRLATGVPFLLPHGRRIAEPVLLAYGRSSLLTQPNVGAPQLRLPLFAHHPHHPGAGEMQPDEFGLNLADALGLEFHRLTPPETVRPNSFLLSLKHTQTIRARQLRHAFR